MASAWIFSTVLVSVLVLVASDPCVSPGDSLSGSTGNFSSPNFPNNFPTNSHCNWTITVPAGRIIKVTFFTFALDPFHNTNCLGGNGIPHVFISNVASDDALSEFKICGTNLPRPVYSVGNSIQVRLLTGGNAYQGFNASYEAIDEGQICPESDNLTERSGVIQSPFHPRKYPGNQTCIWQISAPKGNHVKLEINSINIQECNRTTCPCDYLQIYDGFSGDPNDNKRMCGPHGSKIFYSIHESLRVKFVSDDTRSKKFDGFGATYTLLFNTPPICPPEPISLSGNGKLSSPNYPLSRYPADRNCSWVITVSPEKRVKVKFLELALGSVTYVDLYDGPSATSSLLERFVKDSTLGTVVSSGNQLFVDFRSGSSPDMGFVAQYEPLSMSPPQCNQTTGGPSTYIYGMVNVTYNTAALRLTGKEYLNNGNRTRYIQIILIQRKDEDQDIGSSNDETYADGKVHESSEEGKPYIIAEFNYGEQGTFTIGDEIKYSKTGSSIEYHNGKLKSNTLYAAFQRSFHSPGLYDSEKFVKFKTAEKPVISLTLFIVIVVVLPFVFGISGAIGGFLYAKRRWKLAPVYSNKEMEDVSPDKIPVNKSESSF